MKQQRFPRSTMSALNRTHTIALSESATTALRQRAISPPTTHDQTKSPHRTKARRRRPRQGLPFHCAHRRRGSVSTATARCPMSAPYDFWTVLQKMGPDFAMSLVLGGFPRARYDTEIADLGKCRRRTSFQAENTCKTAQKSRTKFRSGKTGVLVRPTCAGVHANRPEAAGKAPPERPAPVQQAFCARDKAKSAGALRLRRHEAPCPTSRTKPTGVIRPRPNASRCKSRQGSRHPSPNRDSCTGPTWPDPACTICKIAGRSKTTRNGASRCRGRSRTGW